MDILILSEYLQFNFLKLRAILKLDKQIEKEGVTTKTGLLGKQKIWWSNWSKSRVEIFLQIIEATNADVETAADST